MFGKKLFLKCFAGFVLAAMIVMAIGPAPVFAQGVTTGIQPYTSCSNPGISAVGVDGKGYICLNGMWFRPQPLKSIATPEPGATVRQCFLFFCWNAPAMPNPMPVPVAPIVVVPSGTPLPPVIPEKGIKVFSYEENIDLSGFGFGNGQAWWLAPIAIGTFASAARLIPVGVATGSAALTAPAWLAPTMCVLAIVVIGGTAYYLIVQPQSAITVAPVAIPAPEPGVPVTMVAMEGAWQTSFSANWLRMNVINFTDVAYPQPPMDPCGQAYRITGMPCTVEGETLMENNTGNTAIRFELKSGPYTLARANVMEVDMQEFAQALANGKNVEAAQAITQANATSAWVADIRVVENASFSTSRMGLGEWAWKVGDVAIRQNTSGPFLRIFMDESSSGWGAGLMQKIPQGCRMLWSGTLRESGAPMYIYLVP